MNDGLPGSWHDNYICLPEKIWSKLVAIYHGGPPIQRYYPKIYNSLICKATLSDDCKFYYRLKRYSKGDNFRLRDVATNREINDRPYYKYSGRTNWTLLPSNTKEQN